MKKIIRILILVLTLSTLNAEAKRGGFSYHTPGYWGNVELLGGTMFNGGSDVGFSTTHGYCIGHGVSMGLGMGLYVDVNCLYYAFSIPVFMETKYSPLKAKSSPFVSLRTGFSMNDYGNTGFYLSPALGVDIKRFSLFVRYGMNLYPVTVDVDINLPDSNIEFTAPANLKAHSLSVGLAINF
ncbi:MAG: hypothetical protein II216_07335 [Alistipes sp.]|nr:hypothetical protein [Alistipes sp.]